VSARLGERLGGIDAAGAARLLSGLLPDRLLLMPVALGTGAASYFTLPAEPGPPTNLLLVGVTLLAVFLAALHRRAGGRPFLSLLLAAGTSGFLLADWRTDAVAAPVLRTPITASIEATLILAEPRDEGVRLLLRPSRIGTLPPRDLPARIRLNAGWLNDPPAVGSRITGRARLLPPPPPALPGHYDFAFRAWFERIGAVGVLFDGATISAPANGGAGVVLAQLRTTVTRLVRSALPGVSGGLAAALTTGERGAVPEDVQAAMRDAGLAHLLAISGLHLGIVAGTLFFGIRLLLVLVPGLAVRHPVKAWAAALALAGALFYLGLSGASVPTQRAFVMAAFVLLAVIVGRRAITLRSVAWAALVVLVLSPESLLAPGFQMSFAAVTALVAGYEALRRREQPEWSGGRFTAYVGGVLLTSLIATLATAPFAIAHFNRLSVAAVLANLVAVPLTALWIMPLLVLALTLAPLGLAAPILQLLEPALDLLIWLARTVAASPGAAVAIPAMPNWGLGLCTLGGIILCLGVNRLRLVGAIPLCAGLASPYLVAHPDVLVTADGIVGLRSPAGLLHFDSGRTDDFTLSQAAARNGQDVVHDFAAAGPWLRCEGWGCRAQVAGEVVEVVGSYPAFAIACRDAARLVVTTLPTHGCGILGSSKSVIDRRFLDRYGGVAIRFVDGRAIVETVREARGLRPWSRP